MKIFQIHYDNNSKSKISDHFIPFDNSNPEKPNEFEYGVMRRIYLDSSTWEANDHLGVLSWKFQRKTNLHPEKLAQWLRENKSDVYTINPFTVMKNFINVWQQGEYYHPGMIKLVCELFENAGLSLDLLSRPNNPTVLCYCNYWIASKAFWDLYMQYTERVYNTIYSMNSEVQNKMFHIKADKNINSGMFSFVMERMFSTVLAKHQGEFKISPFYT